MRDDNDWYRYFGDSTIHTVGRHGYAVRLPRDSKYGEKDRGEDGSETKDSGGLGEDNAGDNDREEKEDEMKDKIVGWVLIVKHGYKEFWFTFDQCNLAAIFLKTWHNHLLKTDDYDKDENIEYAIRPLFGEESELNEVEDDIPVN